jgi:hypothetical protein
VKQADQKNRKNKYVFHGLSEAIPVSFLNPALILSFLTIFSASGYIGESPDTRAILPLMKAGQGRRSEAG